MEMVCGRVGNDLVPVHQQRDGCLPCHNGCGVIANMYIYMYVSVHMLY